MSFPPDIASITGCFNYSDYLVIAPGISGIFSFRMGKTPQSPNNLRALMDTTCVRKNLRRLCEIGEIDREVRLHERLEVVQYGTFEISVYFPGIDDIGIRDGCKIIRSVCTKQIPIGIEVHYTGVGETTSR